MDKEIQFKIESNQEICQKLWEKFSPHVYLYDEWEYRYCFHKYTNYPFNFIVGLVEGQEIGILPLVYDSDEGYLDFFGGFAMEYNKVFIIKGFEQYTNFFYSNIKDSVFLSEIDPVDQVINGFESDLDTYYLDVSGFLVFDDFLNNNFAAVYRKSLNRAIRKVESLGVKIVFNQVLDLEVLFSLNKKRFSTDEDKSSFFNAHEEQIFRDLVKIGIPWEIMSIIIDDKIVAVSLSMFFNKRYYYLMNGADVVGYPNLGTYLNLMNIKRAIERKDKVIDFGYHDCNWKKLWHLTPNNLYKYKRGVIDKPNKFL